MHARSNVPNSPLHSSDIFLANVFVQSRVQVIPPFEQHGVTDQLEPRGKLQRIVLEHRPQLFLGYKFRIPYFVRIWRVLRIGLDDKNVVD